MLRLFSVVLPMVMIVNPPRVHPVAFGVIGSAMLATPAPGGDVSGTAGGGLAVSVHVFGPYGGVHVWFAADARVRLLDGLGTPGGFATLPVDLLLRATLIPSYTTRPEPCVLPPGSPPETLCLGVDREEPFALQPYAALGGTVVVPISSGDARGGPALALGVQWYLDERVSLLAELEARALLGGPDVAGQLGLNLGLLVAP